MQADNTPARTGEDPRLAEALEVVLRSGQATTSLLQRNMRIGYTRATQIIYDLERRGLISAAYGYKPHTLTLTDAQYRAVAEMLIADNTPT